MSRKLLRFVMLFVVVVVIIGCSTLIDKKVSKNIISTDKEMEAVKKTKDINEKVIDNENLTMIITQKNEIGNRIYKEIGYSVKIINKTENINLDISIDDVTVNGKKNNPIWSVIVPAGDEHNDDITWWVGDKSDNYNPNVESLKDLKNVKGTIVVSNEKTSVNIDEYDINIK
ncbi:hypothetical protein [Terrisporobacter sp.]